MIYLWCIHAYLCIGARLLGGSRRLNNHIFADHAMTVMAELNVLFFAAVRFAIAGGYNCPYLVHAWAEIWNFLTENGVIFPWKEQKLKVTRWDIPVVCFKRLFLHHLDSWGNHNHSSYGFNPPFELFLYGSGLIYDVLNIQIDSVCCCKIYYIAAFYDGSDKYVLGINW